MSNFQPFKFLYVDLHVLINKAYPGLCFASFHNIVTQAVYIVKIRPGLGLHRVSIKCIL